MKAKKIIAHYQRIVKAARRASILCYCWKVSEETGMEYTEEEKQLMREAQNHFEKAHAIVNRVFSKRIGETVSHEVRSGSWK